MEVATTLVVGYQTTLVGSMKHHFWHKGRRHDWGVDGTHTVHCDVCHLLTDEFPPSHTCSRCGKHKDDPMAGGVCPLCYDLRSSVGDR